MILSNKSIIYSVASTRIKDHLNNVIYLEHIISKCNDQIEIFSKSNESWDIFKNYLSVKIPMELVDLIKSFKNECLEGKEITWILENSYSSYPFECMKCCSFVKLKLNLKNTCLWNYVYIEKDKYCKKCLA